MDNGKLGERAGGSLVAGWLKVTPKLALQAGQGNPWKGGGREK